MAGLRNRTRTPGLPVRYIGGHKEGATLESQVCSWLGDLVSERQINEFFGDAEATDFGTGWWSGVLSAFFGALGFGGVLCLHFPQILSSPELRPHYPMHAIRILMQRLIVAALVFGLVSSILRKKKVLAL